VGCGRPGARGGVAQRAEAGCFVSAVGVQQAADADVVFELGAGEAFVASGASSNPTGRRRGSREGRGGSLEQAAVAVAAQASERAGSGRLARGTDAQGFPLVHRIHRGSTSRANVFTLVRPSLTGDLD